MSLIYEGKSAYFSKNEKALQGIEMLSRPGWDSSPILIACESYLLKYSVNTVCFKNRF